MRTRTLRALLVLANGLGLLGAASPASADQCEGDANGDGLVDPLDSGFVLARFGCPVGSGDPDCDAADQNGDGNVDPLDGGFVLARFGPCPPPVVIETVYVGDPGNAGENSGESEPGGWGPDHITGAVDHVYNIGKYEVTAGQYTEFLNAVAATDTYGVYNIFMDSFSEGCQIARTGSSGGYTYSVAADWANRPVNFVSWGDAARFCNWLHNGQPSGPQNLTTTEDGSYYVNGATSNDALSAITRKPDATWAIPSEDEWYKAAYYDAASGLYYDYPTGTDTVPSNELVEPTDPGNNATFADDGFTIGSPYYRTEVGAHENSESPYGTFDQGGNVSEWNEVIIEQDFPPWSFRGVRGGWYAGHDGFLLAAYRHWTDPPNENDWIGFRVVELP